MSLVIYGSQMTFYCCTEAGEILLLENNEFREYIIATFSSGVTATSQIKK